MTRIPIILLCIFLISCSGSDSSPETTAKSSIENKDHHPEINIPGLGVDHAYVADELLKFDVNYRKVYSVSDRDEVQAKINKLESITYPLQTPQDTMVVFSIHALKSTLYSRLSQSNPQNLRKVKDELITAISLIEGKSAYKADLGFEKLALGSLYFMQEDLEQASLVSRDLIENYREIHIPGQPMYISRNALTSYYQMMASYADYSNNPKMLDDLATYIHRISQQNNNQLGIEADRALYHYYISRNNSEQAREANRRIEERMEGLN